MSMPEHELPKNLPVVVYGTTTCPFCMMARQLLQFRDIEYEWVDTRSDPSLRPWLAELSGQTTVPQIFIHGESIGGFTELRMIDHSGELRDRLAAGS